MKMVRDIRQEELDKAFLDGVLMVESLIVNQNYMSVRHLEEASKIIHEMIVKAIGKQRLGAVQGQQEHRV